MGGPFQGTFFLFQGNSFEPMHLAALLPPPGHSGSRKRRSASAILFQGTFSVRTTLGRTGTPARPRSFSQPSGRLVLSRPAAAEVHEEIEAKEGLPSADRNNKATLLLTGPFRTSKSSAKDLTPLVLKLQFAKYHYSLREQWRNRLLRR